jgi:hypothetical protein
MFHHVGAQKRIGEAIEWRCDRNPDHPKTKKECGQTPSRKQ